MDKITEVKEEIKTAFEKVELRRKDQMEELVKEIEKDHSQWSEWITSFLMNVQEKSEQ